MNKGLGLLFVVTCAISCASAVAAPIHDAVRKLDFATVEAYLSQGGNVNLPEEVTGSTPLMIAVGKALPKAEELKNYPFNKQTFMFIKKVLQCGINTGVKQVATRLIDEDPNGDIFAAAEDVDNKSDVLQAYCNEQGECATEIIQMAPAPGTSPVEPKEVDASCPTQDEVVAFIAQVKKDAPNSVTAITDIASAGLDFLFEMAFYDAFAQEPEIKMIKLLREHKAQVMPEMKQNIHKAQENLFWKLNAEGKQSAVRLGVDVILFGLEMAASSYAQSYPAVNKLARWPMNAAYAITAVKAIIDLRNLAVSAYSQIASVNNAHAITEALA
jgi:hypothetical protein